MKKILTEKILNDCDVYVDNIPVKGLRMKYNNWEVLPGIQQYVYEHLQSLDWSLFSLEIADVTIAPLKSQFCVSVVLGKVRTEVWCGWWDVAYAKRSGWTGRSERCI